MKAFEEWKSRNCDDKGCPHEASCNCCELIWQAALTWADHIIRKNYLKEQLGVSQCKQYVDTWQLDSISDIKQELDSISVKEYKELESSMVHITIDEFKKLRTRAGTPSISATRFSLGERAQKKQCENLKVGDKVFFLESTDAGKENGIPHIDVVIMMAEVVDGTVSFEGTELPVRNELEN